MGWRSIKWCVRKGLISMDELMMLDMAVEGLDCRGGSRKSTRNWDLSRDRAESSLETAATAGRLLTGEVGRSTKSSVHVAQFKVRAGDLCGYTISVEGEGAEWVFDKMVNSVQPSLRTVDGGRHARSLVGRKGLRTGLMDEPERDSKFEHFVGSRASTNARLQGKLEVVGLGDVETRKYLDHRKLSS